MHGRGDVVHRPRPAPARSPSRRSRRRSSGRPARRRTGRPRPPRPTRAPTPGSRPAARRARRRTAARRPPAGRPRAARRPAAPGRSRSPRAGPAAAARARPARPASPRAGRRATSRSVPTRSSRAASSHAARRAAYSLPEWVCSARVSITSRASPSAATSNGTCSRLWSAQSSSSACPASQCSAAAWSSPPDGTWAITFSPRTAQLHEPGPALVVVRPAQAGQLGGGQHGRAGQGRGRRQPGAHRDVAVDQQVQAVERSGRGIGPQHRHRAGDVPAPAAAADPGRCRRARRPPARPARWADRTRSRPVVRRPRRRQRALRQRDRQAQAAVVVGVLADQVHPAGRGPHPGRRGAVRPLERGGHLLGARVQVGHRVPAHRPGHPTSRNRAAICSGVASLTHAPIPVSDPARYFSLPGARSTDVICRCSRARSRPVLTGAWCHPAM